MTSRLFHRCQGLAPKYRGSGCDINDALEILEDRFEIELHLGISAWGHASIVSDTRRSVQLVRARPVLLVGPQASVSDTSTVSLGRVRARPSVFHMKSEAISML